MISFLEPNLHVGTRSCRVNEVRSARHIKCGRTAFTFPYVKPPSRFAVVKDFGPVLDRNFVEDLSQGAKLLERIPRYGVVTTACKARRVLAILGRARTVASAARGVYRLILRRETVLDADPVAPGNVQVVLVQEP